MSAPRFEGFKLDSTGTRLEIETSIKIDSRTLANNLKSALDSGKITSLDLSHFHLPVKSDNENEAGAYMDIQDLLLGVVTDYLKKDACKLTTLSLDGWTLPGLLNGKKGEFHKSNQRNFVLERLGKAIRNNSSLISLSLSGCELNYYNIKTFFIALFASTRFLIDSNGINKDKSALSLIDLSVNLPADLSAKESDKLIKLHDAAVQTGINVQWEFTQAKTQKEVKVAVKPKSGEKSERKEPVRRERDGGENVDAVAPQQVFSPTTSDSGSSIVGSYSQYEAPSESYLQSLKDTFSFLWAINWQYVGTVFLGGFGGLAAGAFVGLIPWALIGALGHFGTFAAGTTILGLSVPVFGWALLGAVAAVGLLAGIGYGIYKVVQEYREDVARSQPVEPPFVRPQAVQEAPKDSASVAIAPSPSILQIPGASPKRSTPPTFGRFRPYATSTPESSPNHSDSSSPDSSPTQAGFFAPGKSPSDNEDEADTGAGIGWPLHKKKQ